MAIATKNLQSITQDDLQTLVDAEVAESKTLEFKEILPSKEDKEVREFLYDVDAFANALGGDIIYGVRESNGIAVEIIGVEVENVDKEIRRLEQLVSSGIAPRISGLAIHSVDLLNNRTAIIIRIPRSWNTPHMVTRDDSQRFYYRRDRSKDLLKVDEIRSLSLAGSTALNQIQTFRQTRIDEIIVGNTPLTLPDTPKIVLHIAPLVSFSTPTSIDLSALEGQALYFSPLSGEKTWFVYDFEGLSYNSSWNGKQSGYIHAFHNGVMEAVDVGILSIDGKQIYPGPFERSILTCSSNLLTQQRELGVDGPVILMVTLLNVRGYFMGHSGNIPDGMDPHHIRHSNLLVPQVLVEAPEADLQQAIRPIFNQIWNACGWPRSMLRVDGGT